MAGYRGRFAPSPTGDLHLGGACTALCAWLAARASGGRLVLRMEDLDTPRVVEGSAERILDDLRWLGFDWDEGPDVGGDFGPYVQSARTSHYEQALTQLRKQGYTYECDCSRAEISREASAPHPGEEGPIYSGRCRKIVGPSRTFRRTPATRLAVPQGIVRVQDAVQGAREVDVASETGDFVLRRGDGLFAYQLAVVVDDLEMGITEVVRGADLWSSSARQALIAMLLGAQPPAWAHAPLVVSEDGTRLAKRAHGVAVRHHREEGRDPRWLVARMAHALGLAGPEERIEPRELISRFSWEKVRPGPISIALGD
ncbi:MAG: tRNA glutamyl-Q(34) synthetase GluQRS [Deltaproteobacteria bacterium]|nr:tRNA glutamyl-Q(34) synthetase GluQRS [Deltaproteobacteria bacterium]